MQLSLSLSLSFVRFFGSFGRQEANRVLSMSGSGSAKAVGNFLLCGFWFLYLRNFLSFTENPTAARLLLLRSLFFVAFFVSLLPLYVAPLYRCSFMVTTSFFSVISNLLHPRNQFDRVLIDDAHEKIHKTLFIVLFVRKSLSSVYQYPSHLDIFISTRHDFLILSQFSLSSSFGLWTTRRGRNKRRKFTGGN